MPVTASQPRSSQAGNPWRLAFRPARCRGLTFIELMFATMILGLGVIIIASVFPVAIGEQRATIDASAANAVERNAARVLDASIGVSAPVVMGWLVPPGATAGPGTSASPAGMNKVYSFDESPTYWDRISGDLIDQSDPRYAWTAVYQRQIDLTHVGSAQDDDVTLFITTLASRDTATFDGSTAAKLSALKPGKIKITYYYKGSKDPAIAVDPEEDTIKIEDDDAGASLASAEGAFIVRGENIDPGNPLYPQYAIIKLGTEVEYSELSSPPTFPVPATFAKRYRIAPGFGMTNSAAGAISNNTAWIVGRDPLTLGANRALSCRAVTVRIADPG